MDEETRAALELTDEQLRAMRDTAEPGVVAKHPKRPRDLNQLAVSIVGDATRPSDVSEGIEVPHDLSSFVLKSVKVGGEASGLRAPARH